MLVIVVEFLIYHFFCDLKLDTPENRGVLLLLEGKNIIQTEEKSQKSKGCKISHSFASVKRNHVV